MDKKEIEKLIRNLGYHYPAMVTNQIISGSQPVHHYDDEDTAEIQLDNGIELVFWSETMRFESIVLTMQSTQARSSGLSDILPEPLNFVRSREDVLKQLGAPVFSKSALELISLEMFAWDLYQLKDSLHPEATLEVQYDKTMTILRIIISLMDKNS
jgi:hypothetical protein